MKKLPLRSHFASSPYGWEIKIVGTLADNKRYGYNGTHLRDNDVLGEGNMLDFGGFGYDSRTAMRSNFEPLIQKYPGHSSYMVFGDNPIKFADLDGRDYGIIIDHKSKSITIVATFYTIENEKSKELLKDAIKYWNDASNKFEYIVHVGESYESYSINFQIDMKVVNDPKTQVLNDNNTTNKDLSKQSQPNTSNSFEIIPRSSPLLKSDNGDAIAVTKAIILGSRAVNFIYIGEKTWLFGLFKSYGGSANSHELGHAFGWRTF